MQSYIPAYLRSKNRGLVLRLFMKHKELSRAAIAKQSQISFPTVMKVVDDFLSIGLITETETAVTSENGRGRKSQMLRLNENAFSTIGIFFEGNALHVGLVNIGHQVMDQAFYMLPDDPSSLEEYERISVKMTDAINTLRAAHPETRILGVGVGLPGVVDAKNMTFRRWGKLHNFYDFYRTFQDLADFPLFIENDMNAAALGEVLLRNDEAYSNLLYLSIGTGIGAGIIINEHIWNGDANFAGDVGMALNHLDLSKPVTDLSQLRLNNQCNASALQKRFQVDIRNNASCSLEQRKEISEYIVKCVLPMLYNLSYILDISHYVLSGNVVEYLSPVFFDCMNETLDQLRQIDIIPLQLNISPSVSANAGVVGVANIAFENCISSLFT